MNKPADLKTRRTVPSGSMAKPVSAGGPPRRGFQSRHRPGREHVVYADAGIVDSL